MRQAQGEASRINHALAREPLGASGLVAPCWGSRGAGAGGVRSRTRQRAEGIYLVTENPWLPSPGRPAAQGGSAAASLFLGLLTGHHVPLGHVEGRGVAVRIRGVFKQDRVVVLRLGR